MLNLSSINTMYSGVISRPSGFLKLSITDRRNLIIKLSSEEPRTIDVLAEAANVTLATIRLDVIYLMGLNKVKDISKTIGTRLICSK